MILVTPEMIEAGADIVLGALGDRDCLPGSFSAKALVEEVYRAMDAARPPGYVTKQLEAMRRQFEAEEAAR